MIYPTVNNIIGQTSDTWTKDKKIQYFEETLLSTKRPGIEKVVEMIKQMDFYTAPSSTKFHSNYEGGLLDHS